MLSSIWNEKDVVKWHIILLKLTNALENVPTFETYLNIDPLSPQGQWLSEVRALMTKADARINIACRLAMEKLSWSGEENLIQIKVLIKDFIEEIKLDLELDGRDSVGNVYDAGEEYNLFKDLKEIISSASQKITIIDPFFDGRAFEQYLSAIEPDVKIEILCERYAKDVLAYKEKHMKQFHSDIEIRKNPEVHDRLIIIDKYSCWVMGGSMKDAGKKPTYLIPLTGKASNAMINIYEECWVKGTVVNATNE